MAIADAIAFPVFAFEKIFAIFGNAAPRVVRRVFSFMARTQHLPLYSAIYVFTREIYRMRVKLPKTLKHDLGQEVFHTAIKMFKSVTLANRSQDKVPYITELLLETEVEWALLRLLYDLKGISEGEFKVLCERLSDIGKQAQAWQKWQQSRPLQGAKGRGPKP